MPKHFWSPIDARLYLFLTSHPFFFPPRDCWEAVAGDPSCLSVAHQMLASQRFTGTAARWQVRVNPVGNCHFLAFSGLILLMLLTGLWPWHTPAIAIAGTPTESHWADAVTLSLPSALQYRQEECVHAGLAVRICDCVTAYYGETSRAAEHHCSILVRLKSTGDVFWETLDENTLSHCHIIVFSLFPSPLFALACSPSLPLVHTHTHRQSNLTPSLKTAIIASHGGACYDWGQIEYVCWDQHCHEIKASQHMRSIGTVLVDNIINQSERLPWMLPFLITLTAIISYWPNCHSLAAFIAVSKGASPGSQ